MRDLNSIKDALDYYKAGKFVQEKSEGEVVKELLTDLFFLAEEQRLRTPRADLYSLFRQAEETFVQESSPDEYKRWKPYRQAAWQDYHRDGEVEVDPTSRVSESEEGAYIEAWVWIGKDEVDWEKEDDEREAEDEEEIEHAYDQFYGVPNARALINATEDQNTELDPEPHDVLCMGCGEQIDQCLDPDCTESDHHPTTQYCERKECQAEVEATEQAVKRFIYGPKQED